MEPPFDVDALRDRVRRGDRPKFLFFWGHTARTGSNGRECLSQWFPASFAGDGVRYATAEHFMMAEKARLFGDSATLGRILAAKTPAEAKKLGRSVSGFSDEVWRAHRFAIVVRASLAKFRSSTQLRSFLLATGSRVLVEASPRDRIWGIGMTAGNRDALDPEKWRGLNLLGFALMAARQELAGNLSPSG
jgi:hypothetical protein